MGRLSIDQASLAMVVAAKISGTPSIIGSAFVIRDIVKKWRNNGSDEHLHTTTSLILSMAISDLGSSFFMHFLGSWLLPKESGFPLAAGNEATCTMQSVLFYLFFISAAVINSMLALTYWLTICHGKPESELRTLKWRLFYFVNTWGVSLFYIVATRSIIDPSDVPTTWYCWSAFGQPGSTAYTVTVISALVPMMASTVWVLFCMASLVKFVHETEKMMDRFNVGGDVHRERTREVTKQALMYTVAWLIMIIPISVNLVALLILGGDDFSDHQVLPNGYRVSIGFIVPSRGFLNFLVYFRPKFRAVKKRDSITTYNAVAKVLDVQLPNWVQLIFHSVNESIRTCRKTDSGYPQTTRGSSSNLQGAEHAVAMEVQKKNRNMSNDDAGLVEVSDLPVSCQPDESVVDNSVRLTVALSKSNSKPGTPHMAQGSIVDIAFRNSQQCECIETPAFREMGSDAHNFGVTKGPNVTEVAAPPVSEDCCGSESYDRGYAECVAFTNSPTETKAPLPETTSLILSDVENGYQHSDGFIKHCDDLVSNLETSQSGTQKVSSEA